MDSDKVSNSRQHAISLALQTARKLKRLAHGPNRSVFSINTEEFKQLDQVTGKRPRDIFVINQPVEHIEQLILIRRIHQCVMKIVPYCAEEFCKTINISNFESALTDDMPGDFVENCRKLKELSANFKYFDTRMMLSNWGKKNIPMDESTFNADHFDNVDNQDCHTNIPGFSRKMSLEDLLKPNSVSLCNCTCTVLLPCAVLCGVAAISSKDRLSSYFMNHTVGMELRTIKLLRVVKSNLNRVIIKCIDKRIDEAISSIRPATKEDELCDNNMVVFDGHAVSFGALAYIYASRLISIYKGPLAAGAVKLVMHSIL